MLVFKKTDYIENNEVGSFCVNGECACKRFKKVNGMVMLMPSNPDHEPIVIRESDNFRVIGKLVLKISKF